MKEDVDNEKLMLRYLLGNLAEEQRLQVEKMFLGDDQHYQRLLALENELFYDYAQGKLSPAERGQFEKRFLSHERNRRRAMIASALAHRLSETLPVGMIESGLADRELQFSWQSLKSYFSHQSAAMRVSLATLAIMLLVTIALIIGIVRLRTENDQFRAERTDQVDQLHRQTQQERARADELNLQLKREIDENARLKQGLSKMQAHSSKLVERLASVISFVLAPSMVRDQTSGMKKLFIPPGVQILKLQLNLKGEIEYRSYQVTLMTVDGAERWSQEMLQVEQRGSGKVIVLRLPSRALEEGDYELRLKGIASDGTLEETGNYYYFSIVRK